MTTRDLSWKQIIIPMDKENSDKFMSSASVHVANINRTLKNIKLDILADYVQRKSTGIIIVTNKVASPSNLQTIENVIKNMKNINSDNIETP